jgi:hypothetical protein
MAVQTSLGGTEGADHPNSVRRLVDHNVLFGFEPVE